MKITGELVSFEAINGQTSPFVSGDNALARIVATFPTTNGVVTAPILLPCTLWVGEVTVVNIAECGEFRLGDKIDIWLGKSGEDLMGITEEDVENMPEGTASAVVYFNKIIKNRLSVE